MAPETTRREGHRTPKRLDDVFTVRTGDRLATCSLWTHDLGWECRLLTDGELIATQVCRTDAEIETFSAKWREVLGKKGWT